MISRRISLVLVAASVLLPIVVAVLVGVARLLGAMGDEAGASVMDRLTLAAGIVWVITLISLVTVQGINSLEPPDEPFQPQG